MSKCLIVFLGQITFDVAYKNWLKSKVMLPVRVGSNAAKVAPALRKNIVSRIKAVRSISFFDSGSNASTILLKTTSSKLYPVKSELKS